MASAVREAPAPARGKKAKRAKSARRAPTTLIEDVVTFPIPRKRLFTSFPVELKLDKMRRRTPHIIFEPELEEG